MLNLIIGSRASHAKDGLKRRGRRRLVEYWKLVNEELTLFADRFEKVVMLCSKYFEVLV